MSRNDARGALYMMMCRRKRTRMREAAKETRRIRISALLRVPSRLRAFAFSWLRNNRDSIGGSMSGRSVKPEAATFSFLILAFLAFGGRTSVAADVPAAAPAKPAADSEVWK